MIQSIGTIIPAARVLSGTVIFGMFSLLLLAACNRDQQREAAPEPVRPVKMVTVESSAGSMNLKFPGTVRAAQRADIAFQVGGTLTQIPVGEGQFVKAGQIIAQLDQRDYLNNLRNAKGQLGRVDAALASARSEYDRILRIQKQDPGAASESMVVRRREALDQARAGLESAQAAVASAQNMLDYTTLRAPFGGVVSKRHVDNYQEVQAKQTIVSMDDISSLEILVDLPESVVATIGDSDRNPGSESLATAEFATVPGRQFPLKVKEFSTRADPKTQTYQVVLEMDNPADVSILPGMSASVEARGRATKSPDAFFVLPAVAVFADEQGASNVWVVDQGTMTVQRRKVVTGDLTGTGSIRITDGLQSGEMVAVSGVSQLRQGMQVKPFSGTY